MLILYRVGAPLDVALGQRPIAVAGTRDPTPCGRRLAREVGRRLAEAGYTVVTGFARGVDEEAAYGALEAGGYIVAVMPYLYERDGTLNPRVAQLLHVAAGRASAVAENPVKDDRYVRAWLAKRNRIIAYMVSALIIPEARFRFARWGTRYTVEYALTFKRIVLVFRPRARDGDVVKAYEYLRRRGAVAVESIDEAIAAVGVEVV